MYSQETTSLSNLLSPPGQSELTDWTAALRRLQQFHLWSFGASLGTALGGVGFLLAMVTAVGFWKCNWALQLKAKEDEWQEKITSLQLQVNEARRGKDAAYAKEAECRKQAEELRSANALLRDEIDKHNQAQKALARKRQELESSKTVLEVHVQARTQELQQLQRRYELILNSAGEGICGLDLEGKTAFVNPAVAKMTGWTVEELIGKTEQEIFCRNGANGHASPAANNRGEQVFYRKEGTCFPVEVVRTPLDEGGRIVGSVLMFKDITERKRVEETLSQRAAELARSNAELEQFAFVASHDLQEPLRKIQAFGDRLKATSDAVQAPEARDYLERMQNAAMRMRTLIDDLLAFSRVIRSSEPFVPVDLKQATQEVLGDLEVRIEKTGARVEVGDLPTIEADPLQIRQLMLNLVGNALKFQPPGAQPVIRVNSHTRTTGSGEQLCELSVQDNGIGFDEKYLEKIFAVFQRLHGRTEYEGTGVGLAVCRRIVDRHHGTITARSKPGEGATFIVTLPLTHRQVEARP